MQALYRFLICNGYPMQLMRFKPSFWSVLWIFLNLCPVHILAEGFIAGTLVSTPDGLRAIETLRSGDVVTSRTLLGKSTTAKITKVTAIQTKKFIELVVDGQRYFIDSDQKFYLEDTYRSRQAHALCCGDILIGIHGQKALIEEIHFWNEETPIEVYALSVARYHNFCIGTSELIAHNMSDYSLVAQQSTLVFAAGGGLVLSSPAVVAICGASLLALGISLLAEHIQERNKNKLPNTGEKNSDDKKKGPSQPPEDPNKDNNNNTGGDFFKALKARSKKAVRTHKFGKMYQDPNTQLWWSKDLSNHGGSCYKVFKECAKGFEWQFDADSLGQAILNKHKGPTGLFISYTEVIFLS